MTRIALLQMTSGIDPAANAATIVAAIDEATAGGAAMVFTPEMSGLIDRERKRAAAQVVPEASDRVLAAVREAAARAGIWVAIGHFAALGGVHSYVVFDVGHAFSVEQRLGARAIWAAPLGIDLDLGHDRPSLARPGRGGS